jgi:hypothetical protein
MRDGRPRGARRSKLKTGPTEGGSGGGRGHSNMEHTGLTAEVKEGARRARRSADKSAVIDELAHLSDSGRDESDTEPGLSKIPSFDYGLSSIEFPETPFVLLVAARDARGEKSVLGRFAGELLEAGAVYVCCWGECADELETAFDLRAVELEVTAGRELPLVMTTSHSGEPLAEAVWFWLRTAWPAPEHGDGDFPRFALCVGDDTSADQIGSWITNPSVLDQEVGLE